MFFPKLSENWPSLLVPIWIYLGYYEKEIGLMLLFSFLTILYKFVLDSEVQKAAVKIKQKGISSSKQKNYLSKKQKEQVLLNAMRDKKFFVLSFILVWLVLPYSLYRLYPHQNEIVGFSLFWAICLYLTYSVLGTIIQVDPFIIVSRFLFRKTK